MSCHDWLSGDSYVHTITGSDLHYRRIFDLELNPRHAGVQYRVGADSAYPLRPWLQKGFSGVIGRLEGYRQYNREFASVRESVEWGFGKQYALWPFLDFEKLQRTQQSPTERDYFVGMFLTNCHTCCYGSLTSSYFNTMPPTLEEYLAME